MYYFLVPISIFGALIVIYFLTDKSKRNFDFVNNNLTSKITILNEEIKNNTAEIAELKVLLVAAEKLKDETEMKNRTLVNTIEELKKQIENLNKVEMAEKDNIIIEYFLNSRSNN